MSDTFSQRLETRAAAVTARLDLLLAIKGHHPQRLVEAMRHGVLNGGKRLRPFLMIESAVLFGAAPDDVLEAACALECLHCYSLIHDDLPAMDDDDLRRGQPTVHKAFDEATAILAGDALLTLAFELMAGQETSADPAVRADLALLLAQAAGAGGMIGGQMLDLAAEQGSPDETGIRLLQSMKTGALIRFACEGGAIFAGASASEMLAMRRFGEQIGLAFQLADDLLDVTSDSATMGKAVNKDAARGKGTLVGLLGAGKTRELLLDAVAEADALIAEFGDRAEPLREAARFIAHRKS